MFAKFTGTLGRLAGKTASQNPFIKGKTVTLSN
jgi:hypothetical protein